MAGPLERANWATVAEAAISVGCPVEAAEAYYDFMLERCRRTEMQREYQPSRHDIDESGRLLSPQEPEEMRREYRAALSGLGAADHEAMLKELAAKAKADKRGTE